MNVRRIFNRIKNINGRKKQRYEVKQLPKNSKRRKMHEKKLRKKGVM